ncbi:response regulator [Gemmatimonadota bacterium]
MARILVVDWEEDERIFYWDILEEVGHELLFANDGESALEIWEKSDVDVVVTELYVPEMNGLRLIKEMMDQNPDTRIVAISEISADQLDLAENYGACSVLVKPVEPEDLLAAVDQALEGFRPGRRDGWR